MKYLMIMLSWGVLVNNQPSKEQLEAITGTKVVVQGKVPVVAKNKTSNIKIAKSIKKAKKKTKKAVKKTSQKKKKVKSAKKKVVKKKKKTYKTYRIAYNKSEVQAYAHDLVLSYGWSEYDFECLVKLWNRESSWNLNAVNKRSGACGIPQAYPCSKASKGTDFRTNWRTQVRWGLNYIKKRYGSPSEAWRHSQSIGWY